MPGLTCSTPRLPVAWMTVAGRLGGKPLRLGEQVGGECRGAGIGAAIDVLDQHRFNGGCIAAVERFAERFDQAVKDVAHRLDLPGHAEVGDAELAQRAVHVAEEDIDQRLAERLRVGITLEAAQQQRHVQGDHVEAAGDCVGHAPVGVELLLPGLRHNGSIGVESGVGGGGFTEKIENHGHAPRQFEPPERFGEPSLPAGALGS